MASVTADSILKRMDADKLVYHSTLFSNLGNL